MVIDIEQTTAKGPLVDLRGVTKTFESAAGIFTALQGIDLRVRAGEFVAIIGKSGSGKSTLLNMIAGIDRPTSGEVRVNGAAIHQLNEGQVASWRGVNVGLVFQFFQLIPTLTAIENIMLPMDFCNVYPDNERERRAKYLLELVGIAGQAGKLPAALSGGEQQRVAIARALISDPRFILADEPTGNLDTRAGDEIAAVLQKVTREWHRSIVMVTHDQRIAAYADRIIFLKDGKIFDQTVLDTRHSHNLETVASRMQALGD